MMARRGQKTLGAFARAPDIGDDDLRNRRPVEPVVVQKKLKCLHNADS
jgi:hypothetical protein